MLIVMMLIKMMLAVMMLVVTLPGQVQGEGRRLQGASGRTG